MLDWGVGGLIISAVQDTFAPVIEVCCRRIENDSAFSHANDPRGVLFCDVHLVKIHDDGQTPLAVDVSEGVHHACRRARVEARDRLIGQDGLGILSQEAGDRDSLLLPSRKRVGADIGLVCDSQ